MIKTYKETLTVKNIYLKIKKIFVRYQDEIISKFYDDPGNWILVHQEAILKTIFDEENLSQQKIEKMNDLTGKLYMNLFDQYKLSEHDNLESNLVKIIKFYTFVLLFKNDLGKLQELSEKVETPEQKKEVLDSIAQQLKEKKCISISWMLKATWSNFLIVKSKSSAIQKLEEIDKCVESDQDFIA